MKRFLASEAFQAIVVTVAALGIGLVLALTLIGCGSGSGDAPEPLGPERFGYHYLPVAIADDFTLEYADRGHFERMKQAGDWVVSNLWKAWWDDPATRNSLLDVVQFSHDYDLKLIVRLEDQSRYSNYPPEAGGPQPGDEAWFQTEWTPYVTELVQAGRGKTFAYQVWNEAWEPSRYMIGPTGGQITPAEYIQFLARTGDVIRSVDPEARVLNSALTSITETYYFEIAKTLLPGMLTHTDGFNFHIYQRPGDFSGWFNRNIARIAEIEHRTQGAPWYVTEANHIVAAASDADKFRVLLEMYDAIAWAGQPPECFLAFVYNDDAALKPWRIEGTDLERRILEAWGR